MTSFRVCRCVVCHTKCKCLPFSLNQNEDDERLHHEKNNDDGNPSNENGRVNKNKLLWESFSAFFCLSRHLFTSNDPDDPSTQISILPFCDDCKKTVVKLNNLYEQLGLIQSEISTTIAYLSWTVIKTTTNSTTTTTTVNDHSLSHNNNDSEQNTIEPQIQLSLVKKEENREIYTNIDNDAGFPNELNELNEESVINEDLNEDPEVANIVEHVRQLICDQFSPEVKLKDSVKSLQRQQVLKRRRNNKKVKDRKRRVEQRKQDKQKQTSKDKIKHPKPLPALIKIKTEQKSKSDDDDLVVINDDNQDNDNGEPLSPQSVHEGNSISNLDDTRDDNYDSFDEYFNNDDATTTTTKKKTKNEKNVDDQGNKRKRLKRKVASKISTKKEKRVKQENIVLENVSGCENQSNSDSDLEEEVAEEDPDFNVDVERSQMRKMRKMRPSEIRLTSKKKKKRRGPDYISFQELVLQVEEISPSQFIMGGKFPYEKTDDGDFTCKIGECIFSTKVQKEIHSHLYHMHNEQRFPCKNCQKSYESEKKLAHHVCRPQSKRRVMYKTAQREDGSFVYGLSIGEKWPFFKVGELFQCGTCHVFKAKLNSMGTHIREHHIEPDRYKCPHPNCDNAYGNRKSFLCHTALHLPDRDFLCEECSMSFKSASNLTRHKLVHSSKMFECNVCHKKYMYAEGLNRHRRESGHLSEKVLAATASTAIATTSVDSPSELDLSTTSASNSTAIQTLDPQSTVSTVTTSFIANLVCPKCNTPHENAKKFNIHVSFCGKPKKYLCDFCSKGFHVKSYLHRHIARYHGDGNTAISIPTEKQTRRKRSDYQDNNTTINTTTTTTTSNYNQFQQQNQHPTEEQTLQLLRGQENVQIHVAEFLGNTTAFFTQLPHERIFN